MAFSKQTTEPLAEKYVPNYNEIKAFERQWILWTDLQQPDERSWEFFAASRDLIRLVGVYTAPSGMKRCRNYTVLDPVGFTRLSKLNAAMQEQQVKVEYAKRKELQELEANAFPA